MLHVDLFSGIGGFALAARWMGWRTVQFVEIEPYCQRVLAKNFPGVPLATDIREFHPGADLLAARDDSLLTGGFPCQPHSVAGKRRGRDDERHLWPEMRRVIDELRPRWVVAENVPGLRTTAADEVLADLAEINYACWPLVVGAVHANAPHRRQRVWIVANAEHDGPHRAQADASEPRGDQPQDRLPERDAAANAEVPRWQQPANETDTCADARRGGHGSVGLGIDAANADSAGLGGLAQPHLESAAGQQAPRRDHADRCGVDRRDPYRPDWLRWSDAPQPAVRRLDDGLSAGLAGGCRVPALKALGNAIVPQVAYEIFRVIEEADAWRRSA